MGKYERALKDIYSIFDSDAWKNRNILTFPENYAGSATTYIVLSVVFSGGSLNGLSISGLLLVDVYTEANKGPYQAILIADALDEFLSEKLITTGNKFNTQFSKSNLASLGKDSANPLLYRHTYTIPFSHFGVY